MGILSWEGFKSVKDEEKVVFLEIGMAMVVKRLMGSSEEVAEMRKKVAELAELARMAMTQGAHRMGSQPFD